MTTYKDITGRDWSLSINIGKVKRVREALGIDLAQADIGHLCMELGDDPVKLGDLLYVLCEDQAKAANIDSKMFGDSFDGDTLESATDAFLEALVNFFPARKRDLVKKIASKGKELATEAYQRMATQIDGLTLDQILQRSTPVESGNSSTS